MNKYTFHIVGNAHLPVCRKYMSCAFNIKHFRLAEMLYDKGHTVYVYGAKSTVSPPPKCTEFIETHTVQDIARDFGSGDNRSELGYLWKLEDFRHDYSSDKKPVTLKFYANSIIEINKRKKPDDFLLMMQGYYHQPIKQGVNLFLSCEAGIGYRGSMKENFRAFESAYMQNFSYGSENPFQCINGAFYDRIIPNYFDPKDFEFKEKKQDYFLFIGRMINRKGVTIAIDTCNAIGKKLILAGQGAYIENGTIQDNAPTEWSRPPGTWEYIGYADAKKRQELMSNAKAVFAPTLFLDCFNGVHVESMLCGTPVITTDFGVFSGDTYKHGVHGFKCNTLQDFVDAARNVDKLSPKVIRKHAEQFLVPNVYKKYLKWFNDLHQLYLSTDEKTKGWSYIDVK